MSESRKELEKEVVEEVGTDIIVEETAKEEKTKGFLNKAKKAGKYLGIFALGALSYGVISAIGNRNDEDETEEIIVDDYTIEEENISE